MAQVTLNCFHIIPILERQNSEGMTKIMYPAVWSSNLRGQLLVMVVDGLCPEIVAGGCGEDQRRLLLLRSGSALP